MNNNNELQQRTELELKHLDKVGEKKRFGNIAKITSSVILSVAILIGCAKVEKDITKDNENENLDTTTTIENTITEENVVDLEINDEDVYNENYKYEYEEFRDNNNISMVKAISIINRAHKIEETGFFEDYYVSDIADVLLSIENKNLFTTEHANHAQSFNTTFNRVTDNYLMDQTSHDDVNKMDSLGYMTKNGSDFDKWLEQYRDLLKAILDNPYNQEAKNNMYKHLSIFATSLNGFTTEPEILTSDKEFNSNAQINDALNWYMAYDSFIKPVYPLFFPRALESVDGYEIEKMSYMKEEERNKYMEQIGLSEFRDEINGQIQLINLQYLMESHFTNKANFCEIRNIADIDELDLESEELSKGGR